MEITSRQKQLYEVIANRGNINVSELINIFNKTAATIRKDLTQLENNGLIVRTHGAAHLVGENLLLPFVARSGVHIQQKKFIAKLAVQFLKPNDIILIDSGSTTEAFAFAIPENLNLTVITNSLTVAQALTRKGVNVYVCGGIMQVDQMCMIGPETERYLSEIKVDKAFIGATGVRSYTGLTAMSPLQCAAKKLMIKAANQVYALLDYSKFSMSSLNVFAEFSEIDYIITDKKHEDDNFEELLHEKGVTIIYPETEYDPVPSDPRKR